MNWMRTVFTAGFLLLGALPAVAQTTLYVNGATGNDSVSRAQNSAQTPWRTIGRAAWGSTNRNAPVPSEAAQAGNTVVIAAGTYNFSGTIGNRWGVVYNPVNSGSSASSPITFLASGVVNLTAPATQSPVIGCYERNHIIWRGPFNLDEANITVTADTGVAVLSGGVTGCGIDGAIIDGDGDPGYVDNHNGVRVEGCTSCFIRNTTIHDVRVPNRNHNGSGVMLYDSYNTLIENNRIYDSDNAVFIKGVRSNAAQSGTIVRNNLFENCSECVTVSHSQNSRVYQNVIRNAGIGVYIFAEDTDPFSHPVGDWVFNNTISNMNQACMFYRGLGTQNVRVWNNVMASCTYIHYMEGTFSTNQSIIDWEHNAYFSYGTFADDASSGTLSFAQWPSVTGHDLAAPAAISADPRFVSASDYRLCTGPGAPAASCTAASPARSLGIDLYDLDRDGSTTDVIPAGAYVTNTEVIGPGAGTSTPPPPTTPSAPTNLRIVPGGLN